MGEIDRGKLHLVFLPYAEIENLRNLLSGINAERFLTFEKIPLSPEYAASMKIAQEVLDEKLEEIWKEAEETEKGDS